MGTGTGRLENTHGIPVQFTTHKQQREKDRGRYIGEDGMTRLTRLNTVQVIIQCGDEVNRLKNYLQCLWVLIL